MKLENLEQQTECISLRRLLDEFIQVSVKSELGKLLHENKKELLAKRQKVKLDPAKVKSLLIKTFIQNELPAFETFYIITESPIAKNAIEKLKSITTLETVQIKSEQFTNRIEPYLIQTFIETFDLPSIMTIPQKNKQPKKNKLGDVIYVRKTAPIRKEVLILYLVTLIKLHQKNKSHFELKYPKSALKTAQAILEVLVTTD